MNRRLRQRDDGVHGRLPTTELTRVRKELADALRTILRIQGEIELVRLILDICDADQVDTFQHEGIRCWRPTDNCSFASRAFALEDETQAAIACLFFQHQVVFTVEVGTTLDVAWKLLQEKALN